MLIVSGLMLAAGPVGCSQAMKSGGGPEPEADVFGVVPADFTLDVIVFEPEAEGADGIAAVSSRYVLFPDGALHYGTALPDRTDRLPPFRRVLTRSDVGRLWGLIVSSGLTEAGISNGAATARLHPTGGEATTMMTVAASGERFTIASDEVAVAAPLDTVVRRLGQLAWASDLDETRVIAPRRYDFGPDPYAVYRGVRR